MTYVINAKQEIHNYNKENEKFDINNILQPQEKVMVTSFTFIFLTTEIVLTEKTNKGNAISSSFAENLT